MLAFIAFLGFLVWLTAHVLLLLKIDIPSSFISILLNTGIIVLFFTRIISTANLRQGKEWFLDPSIKGLCPPALKVCTVIIFFYGIIIAAANLIGMFSMISPSFSKDDYIIATRKLFNAVFCSLLSCYMLEFTLNICFGILKRKKTNDSLRFSDT